MPLHNAEKWISETIRSIQNQTFENWELIIIDDFSTDNSKEIVSSFIQSDNRIRVENNNEKGIIPALKLAHSLSTGEFTTRMDADDLMPEKRLQLMYDAILNTPPKSIVTGKVAYFCEGTVTDGYKKYESWLNERIAEEDHFKHIFRECVISSPNWLIKKDDFRHVNFCDVSYPEDYDLVFRWFAEGYKIVSIPETTLLWREHPERTSRNSKVYDQNSFFELKVKWFLKLFPDIESVGIVGMGQKGKLLAKLFNEAKFPFQLYEIDYTKMNFLVEGKTVLDTAKMNDEVILIARYPSNLEEVQKYIESFGYCIGENAFWV